jgi:hypothetical protein
MTTPLLIGCPMSYSALASSESSILKHGIVSSHQGGVFVMLYIALL